MADAFGGSNMTADDCCKQIVNWEERLLRTTASITTEWSRLKSGKL